MLGQITVPKNLCLLRLSAIGDVCHAVAMVQSIQKQWPDTKITWVIGKVEANLLKGLKDVQKTKVITALVFMLFLRYFYR